MNFKNLLKLVVQKEASDLYLRVNAFPRARIHGKIQILSSEIVSKEDMLGITHLLLPQEEQRRRFAEKLDYEMVYADPDIGRFRVNIFRQRGTSALVARHVCYDIKGFKELVLPEDLLKKICEESKGLFLVCGPAGSGKSTTIASMIEYINSRAEKHVVTIEDPIEFLFTDQKSIINQRELGIDVHSYGEALKHVTQQSPDIIFIGNTRDLETMRAAISATELGAFVLTTFHTVNAIQTIIRIVNFFPPHLHDEVRIQLSVILKGIFSLRLIPRKDGQGRIPAYESMIVTPTISALIREGSIQEIQKYIDEGELYGMQSFKQSLVSLVQQNLIDPQEARLYADSKDEFDLEMKGIKRIFK